MLRIYLFTFVNIKTVRTCCADDEKIKMMPQRKPTKSFVTFCLILNIICSIVIVLINKWLYTHYGFPNMTLTCLHFVVTSLGLLLCKQFNLFQPKSLPVLRMLPLSLTFCGFVVFTNLSLQNNTVGTYQLVKTLTTPCIIYIQTWFYSRHFSGRVKLTVVSLTMSTAIDKLISILICELFQIQHLCLLSILVSDFHMQNNRL